MTNLRSSPQKKLVTCLTVIIAFAAAQSWYLSWGLYQTNSLAFHDQGLVNYFLDSTLNGYFMRSPLPEDYNHFAVHIHPTLFVLLPFKLIWGGGFVLVFGQIFLQALGAIPLFLITYKWSKNLILPCLMAVMYFVHKYNIEAFLSAHFEQIYLTTMLAVFAALAYQKRGWAWIFMLLSFGIRDDYAFLGGASGIVIGLFDKENRKFWWQTSFLGIAWFLSMRAFVMPHLHDPHNSVSGKITDNWGAFGKTIPEIILYFVTHPLWILDQIWNHSDYRSFVRESYWTGILSPYGIGTLTPMSYISTYSLTAGRLDYYFSCAMLPFSFASSAWLCSRIHLYMQDRFVRLGSLFILLVAAGVAGMARRNWHHVNPNGFEYCLLLGCQSTFTVTPAEEYATKAIDTFINSNNQSAAITFRHFTRAHWRRELVLTTHTLNYRPCWIFADRDEAKLYPFMGNENLVSHLTTDPEYELRSHEFSYYVFHKKSCSVDSSTDPKLENP